MQKFVILSAAFFALASAGVMTDYGSQTRSEPEPSYGGEVRESCRTVVDSIPQEHCENYVDRDCHTTQRESCREVQGRNCRAVMSAQTTRKCFNVTETRCRLREDVKFETVQVPFVVQKCTKVNERVCGTVQETDVDMKDEVQCINVEKETCQSEDQVVNDRTCRQTTKFDCSAAAQMVSGPVMQDMVEPQRQSGYRVARDTYGQQRAAAQPDASSRDSYGRPQVNCRRTPEKKCYDTPRTVSVMRCGRRNEEQCETMSVSVPFTVPKQSCHNEEKKVCQLEHRQQPKKVKKFEYTKQCRQVPRRVCENEERRRLVPSCVPTKHTECSYQPTEQCEDIPRTHCFQFNIQRQRRVCEETQTDAYGSPSEPSTTSAYSAPVTSSTPVANDDY